MVLTAGRIISVPPSQCRRAPAGATFLSAGRTLTGHEKISQNQTFFTSAPFSQMLMTPSDCSITPVTSTAFKINNCTNTSFKILRMRWKLEVRETDNSGKIFFPIRATSDPSASFE